MKMIYENNRLSQKLIAVFLIAAMLFTMLPASIAYADDSYGFQPEDADNASNSMKMIDVCGLTDFVKLEETDDSYINEIEGVIDGTKAHKPDTSDPSGTYNMEAGENAGIYFTFTMSAGMNNFQRDWFLEKNMNLIQIYDANEEKVVAEYSNGNGALQFWGSRRIEEINNHGTQKTDQLYIGVEQGILGTGDYVIVFGKNICGNNADKQLGKDIKFRFSVKAAPELSEMIATAEAFVKNVKDQNLIDAQEPEKYRQEEVDKIDAAIEAAVAVRDTAGVSQAETEAAAEELYSALEAFKDSINFSIDGIEISGIGDEVNVGDTGTASAKVISRPGDSQYKRVTWSACQYDENDTEAGPAQGDTPADNLIISENSGNWVAAYSGTVWLKATSTKDPQATVYKKVTIRAEEGVLAVNIPDKNTTVQAQVEKAAAAAGVEVSEIQSLKVFTTGDGSLTATDIRYMKENLTGLSVLNMEKAALTELANGAFQGCTNLEKVDLPDTLQVIGMRAFYNCSNLKDIEIPAGVTTISGGAFAGCTSLNSTLVIRAVYPPSYSISGNAGDVFDGAAGDTPASVTAIQVPYSCAADYKSQQGWRALSIEESDKVTLDVEFSQPGTLAQNAQEAMEAKGITDSEVTDLKISSPEGVQMSRSEDINYLQTHFLYATTMDLADTEFEDNKCNANTFKNRISLKYIDLPESTTTIGGTCFYGCKNLRSIKLPESLGNLGSGAFGECEMVGSSIIVGAVTPPTYDGQVFPDCVTTMIVPPQSVDVYKKATGWSTYNIKSQVELSLSAKSISLEVSAKKSLTATVKVYNNNVDTVTWTSSNPKVVSVSPERGKTTTITAVKAGTATITAKAANGYVTASCTVKVNAMAAPASAKASASGYNKVKISWSGVSGAQGYILYRSTSKSSIGSQIRTLSSSARSYTDTGRDTGKTYYYRVRGYKDVNKTRYLGNYSSVVSAKPVLAKATKVKAKRAGTRKIRVSWKKVSGANGYKVYRSTKKNKGFKAVKTIKRGKTVKYTTGKLKKGKRYYFKVRAYRTVGGKKVYSAYSARVSCKAR